MKKNKIQLSMLTIAIITTSLSGAWIIGGKEIMEEHPLQADKRSVENGGTISAIDAYQDGVGVKLDVGIETSPNRVDKNKI